MTPMEQRLARRIHNQRSRLKWFERMEWSWSRTWRRSALQWRKDNKELRRALRGCAGALAGYRREMLLADVPGSEGGPCDAEQHAIELLDGITGVTAMDAREERENFK